MNMTYFLKPVLERCKKKHKAPAMRASPTAARTFTVIESPLERMELTILIANGTTALSYLELG